MRRKVSNENDPRDWFYLAADRLRAADLLWKNEGLTASGIELLQEAVERLLKGYLVAKGWRLIKTHDLSFLLAEASAYDSRFQHFAPLADELTRDFFAQHYPGGDWRGVGEHYEAMRRQTAELISLIRAALPEHARELSGL
ncbi:MAG: HEPN domain-containing protein [Verrucomicrobiae bacterium]|nr:HEPN domain-containing protein [Verrucomicrobiae bacterium]